MKKSLIACAITLFVVVGINASATTFSSSQNDSGVLNKSYSLTVPSNCNIECQVYSRSTYVKTVQDGFYVMPVSGKSMVSANVYPGLILNVEHTNASGGVRHHPGWATGAPGEYYVTFFAFVGNKRSGETWYSGIPGVDLFASITW